MNRDLEFVRNTIEYDDKSQIDLLTSLKQQQALVLGEAFAFSSLIKMKLYPLMIIWSAEK